MRAGNPRTLRSRALVVVAAVLLALGAAVALRSGPDAGPPLPGRPPGLADLWSGRASLVFDRRWTSTALGAPEGGASGGAHVVIVAGTWYLFNRRVLDGGCAGQWPGVHPMATQVRASVDHGRTWERPVTIVAPTAGTPWSCEATDGRAVYDAPARTWRFLFQCLGTDSHWNGCSVERHAADPLGPFAPPAPDDNPVIRSGQLWSQICAAPADRCHRGAGEASIEDEGTFDVQKAAGLGWWVSFHGYDGVHGYRGIARTTTFRSGGWQLDGRAGTPPDAVLTAADAAGWREQWRPGGPVGPGAASLLPEAGEWYQLAEVPDENLQCTPGQAWDLGLFRSRTLGSTHWAQYPQGNPLVYSGRAPDSTGAVPGCGIQYPTLLRDPDTGTTYVMYGRNSTDPALDGIAVYRLEWNRNLLANGDFARADVEAWHAFPGTSTQLAVQRLPDDSPDGTPYLALNCGDPTCAAGESVYQDAPVGDRHAGQRIAFGGTVRADAAAGGRVDITLAQLDAQGREIDRTTVRANLTDRYVGVRGRTQVDRRTRVLRFQLYPHAPGTVRADNLYAIPQAGCTRPRYPAC